MLKLLRIYHTTQQQFTTHAKQCASSSRILDQTFLIVTRAVQWKSAQGTSKCSVQHFILCRFVDLRMAQPSASSTDSSGLKALLILLALGLGIYIVGPSLYWELRESVSEAKHSSSCSPCQCDCTAQESVNVISDCAKLDPVLQDVDRVKLQDLREELKLQEIIDEERRLHFNNAYLEIKKLTSQYQKEAEKCNVGMETSEEAREKAEAVLALEMQKTQLWEYRAGQLGWQEVSDKTKHESESEEVRNLKRELEAEADTSVKFDSTTIGKSGE